MLKVGSQKGGTKSLMLAAGLLQGIEWSEFAAAQPLLEAIGAGAVDLGAVGDAPFLFAFASGGKVRAVRASRTRLAELMRTAMLDLQADAAGEDVGRADRRVSGAGKAAVVAAIPGRLRARDGL